MTESEWERAELHDMLPFLRGQSRPRKLRLFAVACCRRIQEHQGDVRSVLAVAIAERCADGQASEAELAAAVQAARRAYENAFNIHDSASMAPLWLSREPWAAAQGCADACARAVSARGPHGPPPPANAADRDEARTQASLLRDIFGNPFRPPPALDAAWLRWRDATIPRLAQRMYDSRDFAAMPILADAMEEAGCTSADILDHCRGPGPHVRGCHVVDLVLGRS